MQAITFLGRLDHEKWCIVSMFVLNYFSFRKQDENSVIINAILSLLDMLVYPAYKSVWCYRISQKFTANASSELMLYRVSNIANIFYCLKEAIICRIIFNCE